MPEYRLPHLPKPIELSERDFLVHWVRGASLVVLTSAHPIDFELRTGFPDLVGNLSIDHAQDSLKDMEDLLPQLPDDRLRDLCVSLRGRVAELIVLNSEAVEQIAIFAGKPGLDRKKLRRLINRKYMRGPEWIAEPGYRALCRRSPAVFDAAWVLDRQIAERIKELVEAQGEKFEDIALGVTPILRPVDQLRASIESLRDQIKGHASASERLTEIITAPRADLPSPPDKDSDTP